MESDSEIWVRKPFKSDEEQNSEKYTLDRVFWSYDGFHTDRNGVRQDICGHYATQKDVFDAFGAPAVAAVLEGRNALLSSYAYQHTDEQYTWLGDTNNPGLIPSVLIELMEGLKAQEEEEEEEGETCTVEIAMADVFRNQVRPMRIVEHTEEGEGESAVKMSSSGSSSESQARMGEVVLASPRKKSVRDETGSTKMVEVDASESVEEMAQLMQQKLEYAVVEDAWETTRGVEQAMLALDQAREQMGTRGQDMSHHVICVRVMRGKAGKAQLVSGWLCMVLLQGYMRVEHLVKQQSMSDLRTGVHRSTKASVDALEGGFDKRHVAVAQSVNFALDAFHRLWMGLRDGSTVEADFDMHPLTLLLHDCCQDLGFMGMVGSLSPCASTRDDTIATVSYLNTLCNGYSDGSGRLGGKYDRSSFLELIRVFQDSGVRMDSELMSSLRTYFLDITEGEQTDELTLKQFQVGMKLLGLQGAIGGDQEEERVVRNMFDTFDVDNSGTLSFKEVLLGLAITLGGEEADLGTQEELLKYCFQLFDTDGNELISVSEAELMFRSVLQAESDKVLEQKVQQHMIGFMQSRGVLRYDEFVAAVKRNDELCRVFRVHV